MWNIRFVKAGEIILGQPLVFGNKYFDTNEPWNTRNLNPAGCEYTLFNCVQIISNLAVLLNPFLPFSSSRIFSWLNINNIWEKQYVSVKHKLPEISILFERLDKGIIEMEVNKLANKL